jgi:hypothetical protein
MYMWRERSKEEKHEDVVNTGLLPLDVVEVRGIERSELYYQFPWGNEVYSFIVQATGTKAVCEDSVS